MTRRPKTFLRSLFTCCIGLFAAGATLCAAPAGAQTAVEAAKVAAEIDRVASNLPAEWRAVITHLTLLGELPSGAWKMHSGDLSHAETTGLDESGWETMNIPGQAPNDAAWFRQ